MEALANAVDATAFGAWARGSALAYPVANVLHLLGLVLLVGGIGLVDLRVLGVFRALPLAALARALTPLAIAGGAIMIVTGATMFAADAAAFAASPVFRWKLALIAVAALNAFVFRLRYADSFSVQPQPAARFAALLSLVLWLIIGTLGRMIAYS